MLQARNRDDDICLGKGIRRRNHLAAAAAAADDADDDAAAIQIRFIFGEGESTFRCSTFNSVKHCKNLRVSFFLSKALNAIVPVFRYINNEKVEATHLGPPLTPVPSFKGKKRPQKHFTARRRGLLPPYAQRDGLLQKFTALAPGEFMNGHIGISFHLFVCNVCC